MDACNKTTCPLALLVLMNLLIFIAGGTLLIAGFMYKFSSGFLEVEVTNLFNRILMKYVPLGVLADANAYIMIIVGALVMFVAIFGMIGAWKSIRGCLWAFITMAIGVILLQGAIIGLWIFLRQTTDDWLRGNMLKLLVDFDGPVATDELSKGWNKLFMAAECCGVDNQYTMGGTNNDFESVPANWWASRAGDNLPATCCQGVSEDTVTSYVGSALCTTPTPPINFYTRGCYNRIKDIMDTYSLISLIVLGVIFFVQCGGVCFALREAQALVTSIVCACIMVKNNKVRNQPKRAGFDSSTKRNDGYDSGRKRKVEYDTLRKWKDAYNSERHLSEQPKQIRY